MLADDPTGQIDSDTSNRVLELLPDLQAETGTALVVVSLDLWLDGAFDDVRVLRDGALVQA